MCPMKRPASRRAFGQCGCRGYRVLVSPDIFGVVVLTPAFTSALTFAFTPVPVVDGMVLSALLVVSRSPP